MVSKLFPCYSEYPDKIHFSTVTDHKGKGLQPSFYPKLILLMTVWQNISRAVSAADWCGSPGTGLSPLPRLTRSQLYSSGFTRDKLQIQRSGFYREKIGLIHTSF